MSLNLVSLLSSGRSGMYFSKIPTFPVVSKRTATPFELTLFTTNTAAQTIDLYAQFSSSRPYQDPQNRYGHLLPQWEFLDTDLNTVNSIDATMESVSTSDGTVYGLSGTAEFYYRDDLPTTANTCPVLLWATLNTSEWPIEEDNEIQEVPGYSNSKIIAVSPCHVLPLYPDHLEITRNGRENIIPLRWQGVEFPYFITIHADNTLNCTGGNEPIIFDYPQNNYTGSQYEIGRTLLIRPNTNYNCDDKVTVLSAMSGITYPFCSSYRFNNTDLDWNGSSWYGDNGIDYTYSINYSQTFSEWGINLIPYNGSLPVGYASFTSFINGVNGLSGINFDGTEVPCNTDYNCNLYSSTTAVEWDPLHQYFQRTDSDSFHVGGFVNGTIIPNASAETANISATVTVELTTYPQINFPAWVSNPNNNVLHRIIYWGELNQTCINEITSVPLPEPLPGFVNGSPVPFIQTIDNNWALSGFGGIWGIAVEPPCLEAWCTDYEMDAIYKFNTEGDLISTIDLSVSGLSGYSPAGIALDGNKNFWVTIFDAPSVLKYDMNGNHLLTIVNSAIETLPAVEDYTYKPGPVETDTENNIWVGYANSLSSSLVKYDTSGNQVATGTIEISATPFDIAVDWNDNSIWVTQAHSNLDLLGKIEKFDSTGGSPVCSYSFPQPSYITLDDNKTAWFTFGYQKMGYITTTGLTGSYVISASEVSPLVPPYFDEDDFIQDHAMGGITINGDEIWVIQSIDNKVYVISADPYAIPSGLADWDYFKLAPDANIAYGLDINQVQYSYNDQYQKSAQAYGDWTGGDWIKKYSTYYPENSAISYQISGMSSDFYILPFDNRYDIRRFNESWNAGSQIRSYALPEHINSNYNLWENWMGNAWGSLSADEAAVGSAEAADRQSFGRMSYEKIANYAKNHSDIELSNVDQLYSIAQELDVPIDDYNFEFPTLIDRIMDIVSVSHNKLWGARCKCERNFNSTSRCSECNHQHGTNLGDLFLPFSYTLSAGTPFVVKPKFISDQYDVLNPTINGPLSGQSSISWLTSAQYPEYDFFEYIPGYCNEQVEGIVNWSDRYTTLSENNSSLSAWYDEYGIVEEMISYYLHKGLGLNN